MSISTLEQAVRNEQPVFWANPYRRPIDALRNDPETDLAYADVLDAERRWQAFAPLLEALFPNEGLAHGRIDSPLIAVDELRAASGSQSGRLLLKCDHLLPIAGSIKARGGIYEVLVHAQTIAIEAGLITSESNLADLATPAAKQLFANHSVSVGSTGNLGLSIGITASALGFKAVVHMSRDAKQWKKALLRDKGANVVEHHGDFTAAVAAGRALSQADSASYFVDDESSSLLFLGYSSAALTLADQLAAAKIIVDREHPLFVYLPCGVGGAPGGITFGLRHVFGDDVHCIFAEPTATPAMLVQLALSQDAPVSIYDFGLDGHTEADGLAVGSASQLVAPIMKGFVDGIYTLTDCEMFTNLELLFSQASLRVEPSAAAALGGPVRLTSSADGIDYLERNGLTGTIAQATHIIWTTGGALLPPAEFASYLQRGVASRLK